MKKIKSRLINIFLIIVLPLIAVNGFSQNFDINLLKKINVHRNKALDPTFKFITNSMTPVSIGSPILILSVGFIKKDSLLKHRGLYLIESAVVAGFISTALKFTIKRERPFRTYPFIQKETGGGSYSFPSGHTSEAFATATSLSIAFPKWYVIAPTYLWAGAVGYSRMHLGVHYPTDVLAGAIVGAGSAYLTYKINRWLQKKKQGNISAIE